MRSGTITSKAVVEGRVMADDCNGYLEIRLSWIPNDLHPDYTRTRRKTIDLILLKRMAPAPHRDYITSSLNELLLELCGMVPGMKFLTSDQSSNVLGSDRR